ncbi:actin [Gracilaria domingensis]|nr:actin [Gracilaria domingensis]
MNAKEENIPVQLNESAVSSVKEENGVLPVPNANGDEATQTQEPPQLRCQHLKLKPGARLHKPEPKDVIVLAFGSSAIRYGFASDSTPRIVFPAVAFLRSDESIADRTTEPFRIPTYHSRSEEELKAARAVFDEVRDAVAKELSLSERRRGGGRPIPWKAAIETVPGISGVTKPAKLKEENAVVLVGHDVELLLHDEARAKNYDIVMPMWDGKLLFDCGAPASLIRKSLDVLMSHIVSQLMYDRKHPRKGSKLRTKTATANGNTKETKPKAHLDSLFVDDGYAKSFVALVVPETAQRRDVSELVDAVFSSKAMQTAAIFIHQSAVSCAFGAGLATCAVVDIGHSATTVACVEDGVICGESRIHLEYGSWHIQNAFEVLLRDYSTLHEVIEKTHAEKGNGALRMPADIAEDLSVVIAKTTEQLGGFNVDENDNMNVAVVKAPSGISLRLKLGVGIRTLPCYGLIYPKLLKAANELSTPKKHITLRTTFDRNSEDDNFVSDIFNDLRRSGIATAALPVGLFANEAGQPAAFTINPKEASIVDAIIWSVARAVEIKRPDQQSRTADTYRRYLNAVVLAGGGASIDGIALALEGRIKKGFLDAGVTIHDVSVIDGGKGKTDEELAAAAAILKDVDSEGGLIDDTDTATLPWKGGAVMVEADAVGEYWVYRDDWRARNVRALRERAPFYW